MVQSYQDVLTEIVDKHCPIKKKTFKPRPTSVWYTNDLRELKRKRRRLERLLKKDNTLENKDRYRQVKCNYNWELKKARIVYYKRWIGENKNNEKSLNRIINKLTGKNVEPVLPKHGSEGDIAREICNFFNEKIVNIRNKIRKDEVIGYKSIPSDISTLSSLHETSETKLQNIIMNTNSKSCSLEPIPTWLVKSSFNELKMAMLYIVNRSLVIENTFPETLKH